MNCNNCKVIDALNEVLLTIESRTGLRDRRDLITADELNKWKRILYAAEGRPEPRWVE